MNAPRVDEQPMLALTPGLSLVQVTAQSTAVHGGYRTLILDGPYAPVASVFDELVRSTRGLSRADLAARVLARTEAHPGGASLPQNAVEGLLDLLIERNVLHAVGAGDPTALALPSITLVLGGPHHALVSAVAAQSGGASSVIVIGDAIDASTAAAWHPADPTRLRCSATLAEALALAGEALPSAVIMATALTTHQLYAVNRWALANGSRWLFASPIDGGALISPVISRRLSACYACLRLRCIGTTTEPETAMWIESRLVAPGSLIIDGPPLRSPYYQDLLVAGAMFRSLTAPTYEFTRVSSDGEVRTFDLQALPGCPACGNVRER